MKTLGLLERLRRGVEVYVSDMTGASKRKHDSDERRESAKKARRVRGVLTADDDEDNEDVAHCEDEADDLEGDSVVEDDDNEDCVLVRVEVCEDEEGAAGEVADCKTEVGGGDSPNSLSGSSSSNASEEDSNTSSEPSDASDSPDTAAA
ncbi:hypothetical protein LSAT2_000407 [Lamellibrachia satsuma]|nr:hypothetical protein LSAT2_000407 [Lamellibrachia satsuma]